MTSGDNIAAGWPCHRQLARRPAVWRAVVAIAGELVRTGEVDGERAADIRTNTVAAGGTP